MDSPQALARSCSMDTAMTGNSIPTPGTPPHCIERSLLSSRARWWALALLLARAETLPIKPASRIEILGHVPVVALSLVELKKGPSSILDKNRYVKGGFEIHDGKLDGTPCVGQAEKNSGNSVWP